MKQILLALALVAGFALQANTQSYYPPGGCSPMATQIKAKPGRVPSLTFCSTPPAPPPGPVPSDIAGLMLWLQPSTLGAGGSSISTWPDSSGNGKDFTQVGSSQKPTVVAAALNGYKVASFDGGDYLFNSSMPADSSITIYIVVKNGNTSASYAFNLGGAGSNAIIYAFSGTLFEWFSSPRTTLGTGSTTVYKRFSTTVGSGIAGQWNLATDNTAASFLTGQIAEVFVFDSVLSAGNQTAMNAYLDAKYGI